MYNLQLLFLYWDPIKHIGTIMVNAVFRTKNMSILREVSNIANQGGTSGSGGERNRHPSHPSRLYDATAKADQNNVEKKGF